MNSSPLSPAGAAGPDPWSIAQEAQQLKDSAPPAWQLVARNVALIAGAILVNGAIVGAIALCALSVYTLTTAPLAALAVAALLLPAAIAAAIFVTDRLFGQIVFGHYSGADIWAERILRGPLTDDKVDAFLSVQHLCRELDLRLFAIGYSDFDAVLRDDNGSFLAQEISDPAGRQLVDEWLKSCRRPMEYVEIVAAIDLALLDWYVQGLTPANPYGGTSHSDETLFHDGVAAGTYSDDGDGRRRFVLDRLPPPNEQPLNLLSAAQAVRLIEGMGPQCRRLRLPRALQDQQAVVQALLAQGYSADPADTSGYRR